MPFDDTQEKLNRTRANLRKRELSLFAAKEKFGKLGREKARVIRFSALEAEALARQELELDKKVKKLAENVAKSKAVELARLQNFLTFTDPRQNLGHFDDNIPILLFPLRIETRFKTLTASGLNTGTAAAVRRELWVRVYPDDIAVDSFEELLSESEARDAAVFHSAMQAAGADEVQKRSAWRALVAGHGSGRAHWILQTSQPSGAPPDTKLHGWSQAPKTHLLPERLILMAFQEGQENPVIEVIGNPIPSSLAVGPDPSLDESEQIRIEDGNIVVNTEMQWMVDFEQAVARGMGFRVPLSAEQEQRGFDKLYVLGVKLSSGDKESKRALETLIDHHHHSRKGFSLLRQGTPTNNTDKDGAGYSWQEDPDKSFDRYFQNIVPADESEWQKKKDGRILAEMLGIDVGILKSVEHYYHTDQAEARAMNQALWPATLGYFMESMMEPVFSDAAIRQTRDFFIRYVSGRGAIPAIRVGKQPYGILPATPFRRIQWPVGAGEDFLTKLYGVFSLMSEDWRAHFPSIANVNKEGDPHQLLLDIVGLHPSSAEFYSRNAQSFDQLFNTLNYQELADLLLLLLTQYVQSGVDLLQKFGHNPKTGLPDILEKFFFNRGDLLKGFMIDDVPLSETEVIRFYTDNDRNYIQWLIDAAKTSHNELRQKKGFSDNQPPSALLFLMLHHALDLGYVDTDLRLRVSKAGMTQVEMIKARQEPKFINIQEQNDAGSRWGSLYRTDARITGSNALSVGDFIPTIIGVSDETRQLQKQLAGLETLKSVPTARLERLFVEHLDLCTYRLDAWIQALVSRQLDSMRHVQGEAQTGIYLGAYGWVENLRTENKVLAPVVLEPELAEHFDDPEHPLTSDSTNGGYIHAPSTNHAVTAAVLRNGYLENASAANPGSFAVNLSSDRVRLALGIIEGMQAGQSLSALLGYRLERGLHDRNDMEVDGIIYNLRSCFPLSSNRLKSTKEENLDSIDAVEARNVVDALSLLEHIQNTGNDHYPFGQPRLPNNLSVAQKEAIDREVEAIRNINDAVADLAIAESVHQVVQGNYDRAAATLDTYSKGNFPPTPDVIKQPRSGVTLTHRIGLQWETGLDPADVSNKTPRSQAEPAGNKWLGTVLPDMNALACTAEFTTLAGGAGSETVTLDMLGLLPIDALYMANLESEQAMATLDDAVSLFVFEHFSPALDSNITIRYADPVTNKISLHEAAPLFRSLKALVTSSRPLNAGDVMLMNETSQEATKQNVALNKERIALNKTALDALKTQVETYKNDLVGLLATENADQVIPRINDLIHTLAGILQKLSLFGLPQTGGGFMWQWQQTRFRALSESIDVLSQRQQEKLDKFDAAMAEYTVLSGTATNAERYTLLQTAERFISTTKEDITALSPDDFRDNLLVRKTDFETWMTDTGDVLTAASLNDSYTRTSSIETALPAFDTIEWNLQKERVQILVFAHDLQAKAQSIQDDLQKRLDKVTALITRHDAAPGALEKVNALLAAGKQLFGDEFKIIPEFTLSPGQAAEWQSSYAGQTQLLSYQIDTLHEDFPVDNWLYGMARVREKMGHVENATVMAEVLAGKTMELKPVQMPYRAEESWLALEYPQTKPDGSPFLIEEDKLLYTAHYSPAFDGTKSQCGLLLDEWTEIIPGTQETTGLTFHYDRPNSEPPQTLLLVTPADFTGQWKWKDLVDTLHDTLDMAKIRAVEPEHIDRTAYAHFLPALMSAFTVYPITASLNLALNNQFYLLRETEDE